MARMRVGIPTLLLEASGNPRWQRVVLDTTPDVLRRTLRRIVARLPASAHRQRYVRSFLQEGYAALSYVLDWREAFQAHPDLAVRVCNINDLVEFARAVRELGRYQLIFVMHSAAGDNLSLLSRAMSALQNRSGRLVILFGNEYNLMPEKIAFALRSEADYIATQLPIEAGRWLYADCVKSKVIPAPAGLNPNVYRPAEINRTVDIGFRGDAYSFALGDVDRTRLIEHVRDHAGEVGITTDIAFSRVPRVAWSSLLQSWHGIVGAESGTSYLEKDDRTQRAVLAYLSKHPNATFDEIHEMFFRHIQSPVSGKAISSRHFEPIGTKTCQLLLRGNYNGLLRADEHYIGVRPDLSDLGTAIENFKDPGIRRAIVERAYEYVLKNHTYGARVESLVDQVLSGANRSAESTRGGNH